MNYFAHAVRFLDRPYFLAGLAVPDWLSVVDRRVRVRSRHLQQCAAHVEANNREIVAGIAQHLEDDRWFHATAAFYRVSGSLGGLIRTDLEPRGADTWPYGFLGHLLTELLLDAALFTERVTLLDSYYEALEQVDGNCVAALIERVTQQSVPNLPRFIDLFRHERFLYDYLDDSQLLWRMNQVMRRVGLPLLPRTVLSVLPAARRLVREERENLLPPDMFGPWPR